MKKGLLLVLSVLMMGCSSGVMIHEYVILIDGDVGSSVQVEFNARGVDTPVVVKTINGVLPFAQLVYGVSGCNKIFNPKISCVSSESQNLAVVLLDAVDIENTEQKQSVEDLYKEFEDLYLSKSISVEWTGYPALELSTDENVHFKSLTDGISEATRGSVAVLGEKVIVEIQ